MVQLIDSHCHLDFPQYAKDLEAVIERALKGGVYKMVSVGIDEESSRRAGELSARFPSIVYPTLGLHPHDAKRFSPSLKAHFYKLLDQLQFVAIGETGLDYAKEYSPKDLQKKVFLFQIELSLTTGLPLIVHTRDADDDTVDILKDLAGTGIKGVIHCFSGGRRLFETALDIGFYISCSGIVTFKGASKVQGLIKECPIDRLLVETDSPFLAPVPFRRKTNEPLYVRYVAEEVARLKSMDLKEVASWTTRNALALFDRLNP